MTRRLPHSPRIGITLGDPAGIGPEVVLRSLRLPAIQRCGHCVLFGSARVLEEARRGVRMSAREFRHLPITVYESGCAAARRGRPSVASGHAAWLALHQAATALRCGEIDLLVTAPASKAAIQSAHHWFPGHTEWLARRFRVARVGMFLVGGRLRIMLVTRHVPLRHVARALTRAGVRDAVELCAHGLSQCFGVTRPRIAVAGLNPHAGESGTLGDEEARVIRPAIRSFRRRGMRVTGPIAPDALFVEALQGRHDAVVAMYHDQGLIPLKLLARDEGVNVTVGLPYVRTAPDHGTAYDIASRFIAHPGAMQAAIELAARIWRRAHARAT